MVFSVTLYVPSTLYKTMFILLILSNVVLYF